MNYCFQKHTLLHTAVALALSLPLLASAAPPSTTPATISGGLTMASTPMYVAANVAPIVMLNVTKDHQLFYRAYNDYTDLDGDKQLETTYKHSFNYYGYFDFQKCYTYDASAKYFKPVSVSSDKYCAPGQNQWSGNFLNWVSMARIDVLRKVLYGGTRYIDTATTATDSPGVTVLERTLLPTDAHAWVKYFTTNDSSLIGKLTPFSNVDLTPPSSTTTTKPTVYGAVNDACPSECSVDVWTSDTTTISPEIGDQVELLTPTGKKWLGMITFIKPGQSIVLRIPSSSFEGGSTVTPNGTWKMTNLTRQGLSFCNVTYASGDAANSHSLNTANNPPLIRVVRGDYSLWAANERTQCLYAGERGDTLPEASEGKNNGNRVGLSGLNASAKNPPTSRGLFAGIPSGGNPDYIARVQVCASQGLIGKESCRAYGTDLITLKPIGLLQEFGEGDAPSMRFGLVTGSYDSNISGGILRRGARASLSKAGYADNEINPATGVFIRQNSIDSRGIIETIDRLRMYGYQYFGGTKADGYMDLDNCQYQQMGMTLSDGAGGSGFPALQGNCSSWGNPIGEMYLESLRYLAGAGSATSDYVGARTKDDALGLPRDAWSDPLTAAEWCTPLTTLVFNSSSITYDHDQLGNADNLPGGSMVSATNAIGTGEGLNGAFVSIGALDGDDDRLCTAKQLGNLSHARGICPEAPALEGSYHIAGLAWRSRVNKLRTLGNSATDENSMLVQTYAVQLASSTPRIAVNVDNKTVNISPAYRLVRNGAVGGGSIVDFRVVKQTATEGVFYIAWEDSSAGADYDQDVWGIISYKVDDGKIAVTTRVVAHASENPQGFGYTISGTGASTDGAHFHSGILGFEYDDPRNILSLIKVEGATPDPTLHQLNSSGGCKGCQAGAPATTATYSIADSSTIKELKDPLYYAAKWGGFTKSKSSTQKVGSSTTPFSADMIWDALNNETGLATPDGVPDNYYYVTNPIRLQDALRQAFLAILSKGSSSGVAANSYSLSNNNAIFQAGFKTDFWSGWLQATRLNPDGTLDPAPLWTTDTTMAPAAITFSTRVIYTRNEYADGRLFEWNSLSSTQQGILNGTDALGESRLKFLRGDVSLEKTLFRERPQSLLGDIVASSPIYVGPPTGRYDYPINLFNEVYLSDSTYSVWRENKSTRTEMLYVGANDGMLHGFDATTGVEKFAFVPNSIFKKLPELTKRNYVHQYFVDGSPMVADVKFNSGWKSVLVGGAGAGGRGYFALDVSDPSTFTNDTNAAVNNVLWEFTNADDPDLGYAMSRPIIVKLNNGKWAAIFGNGYYNNGDQVADANTSGTARIYVLLIEEGADATAALDPADKKSAWVKGTNYYVIDTKSGSASAPNGIGQLVAFDSNLDGIADEFYGGDLKGNMWKFDLTASSPSQWKVAYGTNNQPDPLITVCSDNTSATSCNNTRLPITLRPTVTFHPQTKQGKMVFFGTGKYLETADQGNPSKGWVFGVWDNGSALGNLGAVDKTAIITQTITDKLDGSGNAINGVRDITDIKEDWTKHKLWREQLPVDGERMTGAAHLINGILLYTTYIPSVGVCTQQGKGWLMGVRFQNGGRATYQVFDTNGQNGVTDEDVLSGGISINATLGEVAPIKEYGRSRVNLLSTNTSGGTDLNKPRIRGSQSRVSWRELFRE